MRVRLAQQSDIPAIREIYGHYVLHSDYTFDTKIPSVDYLSAQMTFIQERHAYLVIEEEKGIQGYAYSAMHRKKSAYDWVCEVTIYLNHKATGKAIGKKLYDSLIKLAEVQGYHILLAGITSPNPMSEKFHENFGFVPAIRYEHIGFKSGEWKNVVWWRKELRDLADTPSPIRVVSSLTLEDLVQAGLEFPEQ
jgi:L-amino acid N-acyltransferase YncA